MTQESGAGQREPTEEELQRALDEQMRRISIHDVLLQTVVTLVNLTARRIGLAGATPEERDLDQARLGIDAIRALLPLLPEQETAAVRDALSQLQMAYAQVAQGGGEEGVAGPSQPSEGAGEQEGADHPSVEDVERAKARSKIWTPPGT